ncbi:MAG TPA: hypothetical protein VGO40_01935 [Longimicrobium sp.]|jgi:hypothetical protein|nr:hypothetical protein [Longimicrobium sp.]
MPARDIPESDWKVFRTVREAALDRYCARVLDECAAVIQDTSTTNHKRYLRLYRMLDKRDDDLASAFNDFRRSTAIIQLARIHNLGVVTDEELGRFSKETRELVTALVTGDFGD